MHRHLASAGRPRFDIADIVRAHRAELERHHRLGPADERVLSAIALCRTAALGGHLEVCRSCGHEQPVYHSCRNRHCPKCQALAQEQWIAARAKRLLPVRHFHVVFTLPAQLRALCRWAPRAMYDGLFEAASATLLELAASRWRALPGITAVLHTWTRELHLHPHLHLLVTAGGLHLHGEKWHARRRYLFPYEMMAVVFRAKMLDVVRRLRSRGVFERFADFEDPEACNRLLARLANQRWVVYTKEPFRRAEHVLRYLGRYTHRVAISHSRLVDVSPTHITFRTRGAETATLAPIEFLRRFLLHVLPDGFHKIRHYGLYASAHADTRWVAAKDLLGAEPPRPGATADTLPPSPVLPWPDQLHALTGRDVRHCPRCGGALDNHPLPRAPPLAA